MPDEIDLFGRRGQQLFTLGWGEQFATRHNAVSKTLVSATAIA
jgi:hypothetical protein